MDPATERGSAQAPPPSSSVSNAALEDVLHQFPPEVQSAIAQVLPSADPLDQPDFSTLDYINDLFPSEQSLNNLDDVISEMRFKVQCVDDEIRRIVRSQTQTGSGGGSASGGGGGAQDASAALEEAQQAIVQLFTQIRDIKQKAGESEAMVRDITRDIKQLDTAKRNLTASITTLNHLHMLVGGVSTLQGQCRQRQYAEAAQLLQGLMQVLEHFSHYEDIPQIKELSDQVDQMRRELSEQITADFQQALSGENAQHFSPTRQLAEACLVVDVLEPKVKRQLLKWLISRELAEYGIIFGDGEENTWLDKIDTRYNWLKRHLIEFEERLGPMFPPDWEMSERIAVEFCDATRKHLERAMFKRKHEIDTKLLLHAIQRTGNFEKLLAKRFTGVTLDGHREAKRREEEAARGQNPFDEKVDDPANPFYEGGGDGGEGGMPTPEATLNVTAPFDGIIGQCFEPYLSIYIESQDRNLADLIERAAQEQRQRGSANLANEGSSVLHSCGDLFVFYKTCMKQCSQLSTGEPLLALSNVFKKYLREYATQVLISNLPKTNSSSNAAATLSSSMSMTSLTKELKDFSTSGLLQNFQSLLKEGDAIRLTDDEKVMLCTFLVTSEYCLETTQQLEGKLREKVDADYKAKINFAAEQDVYHGVINNCLQLLVQDLESRCEPCLTAQIKMIWSNIDSVGDQSAYVTQLVNHLKQAVPLVRRNLDSSRKYFTQFCVKFASAFIPKFIQHVYRCKPINTVGAEQLLLDTHSVKTLLLDLPSVGGSGGGGGGGGGSGPATTTSAQQSAAATAGSSSARGKAPASYTKIVVKGMTRAEMTLKVVMSPADPIETFVEQYIKLVPDVDQAEFQKVLDMKGIRKVDQAPFVEYFRASAPQNVAATGGGGGSAGSAAGKMMSPATTAGGGVNGGEESRIKKLENLIKKKL